MDKYISNKFINNNCKIMNFLLFRSQIEINKPGTTDYGYGTETHPPLGLLYVAASLENDGHKVEIIDLSFENPTEEMLSKKLSKTDIIGMEVYSDNYKNVANYTKMLKKINPNIPIIIGGPHCIFFQEKSIEHIPDSDIAIIGEGESTIIDIVRYFQGQKKLCDINNIYYKENNSIKSGKPLNVIENVDTLPFPARHLVEKYDYDILPRAYLYKKKLTLMETSRGCPFRCRFCSRYQNFIKGYGYRQRSAENVVKEILEIDKSYGAVLIVDDNFLADKKRAHRIFDMLIDYKTDIEILIMGARVDSADRELYQKMKKANVTFIGFGIESGNQDVLDFYNKKISLDQIKKAVKIARDVGFQTEGTIMLGAPIETKNHLKKTIKFINSLPLDFAIYTVLKYYKGSSLWFEAINKEEIDKDEFCITAGSRKGLGNFTSKQLIEFSRRAYRSFYIRPRYIFDQFRLSIIRKDFTKFKNSLSLLNSIK